MEEQSGQKRGASNVPRIHIWYRNEVFVNYNNADNDNQMISNNCAVKYIKYMHILIIGGI